MKPLDRTRLLEALTLAEGSFGLTEPNPRVGCVLGLEDGTVLGPVPRSRPAARTPR